MLRWLGRLLGGKSKRSNPSASRVAAAPYNPPGQRLPLGYAKDVEAALNDLLKVGLRLVPSGDEDLNPIAAEIVEQDRTMIRFGKQPTAGDWALRALQRDPGLFENAGFYQDHCFDGISLEDYSSVVSQIVALAHHEWPVEGVEVRDAHQPQDPIGCGTVSVTIRAKLELAFFELSNAKDFDWSIIFRLNERLPREASGRFAIFLDGNATIIFLTPDQIRQLNSVCGYEFFYEEYPEGSKPKTQNSVS